jgi:hypothetical protein
MVLLARKYGEQNTSVALLNAAGSAALINSNADSERSRP